MQIKNGKDTPLNQNSGTVPDVSGALLNWLQPITFGIVVKTIENYQVVETKTDYSFEGVWQPFSKKRLSMKPEGQRAWSWYELHSTTALALKPDDVVTYLGVQYRVMAQSPYNLYGYYEYELIEDYTGSGPS